MADSTLYTLPDAFPDSNKLLQSTTAGVLSLVDDSILTTEEVQDIVGAMFSSNTETRITATYEDGDGTIDLVVDDMTTDTTYSAGSLLDLSGTTFNVDLTELTDGTADVVGSADELVYLDDGTQKRKQIDEIKLSSDGSGDLLTDRMCKTVKYKYPNSKYYAYPDATGAARHS